MVVQCDQCNAKFKLDDSKVKAGGVKVRCAKCKHIFEVRKEQPQEEDFDSILNGLDASTPPPAAISPVASSVSPPVPTPSPSDGDFDFGEETSSAGGESLERASETVENPDKTSTAPAPSEEMKGPAVGETEGFDFGDFNFSEEDQSVPTQVSSGEESDGFSFGDINAQAVHSASVPETTAEESGAFDFGDFSFGDDSEVDKGEGAGSENAKIPSFDATVKMDSFSLSQNLPPQEEKMSPYPSTDFPEEEVPAFDTGYPGDEKGEEFSFGDVSPTTGENQSESGAEKFSFGNFDFTETSSTVSGAEEDLLKPAVVSEPDPASRKTTAFAQDIAPTPEDVQEEEMPPLSITGRRKLSRSIPFAVVGVGIIVFLAVIGGGYYIFMKGTAGLDKIGLGAVSQWLGGSVVEDGKIVIAKLSPSFVVNKEAGELFVINGEAINNFKKARASIQVKAVIYGSKGEVKLQKSAFCGNALSADQLATMPLQKIEAAMSNQFGDSLANLGIPPGKTIPFTVVFTNVPNDAGEFGVEVINSTVASQ